MRDTLWREVEKELEKNPDSIDPDFIDSRINELCELEAQSSGKRPPEVTETQINAVIARITARSVRKIPAKRLHPVIRVAAAACIALFFALLANYMYARANDRCLMSEIEITLCCGTDICPCPAEEETSTQKTI